MIADDGLPSAPVDVVVMPFSYSEMSTPEGYLCCCGKRGVRLYRKYSEPVRSLLCRECALQEQRKGSPDQQSEHSIGWRVAAVPTEAGDEFWGFSAVPENGVEWWDRLPAE